MTKRTQNRIPKSREELRADLNDQLRLLVDGCLRYDSGFELAGKQIATTLRILLYEYKQSRSLLEQLNFRSQLRFIDTAGEIRESNLLAELNLLAWGMRDSAKSGMEFKLAPLCLSGVAPPTRLIPFPEWWSGNVVRDANKNYFSRLQLVTVVANTDGGAHVDAGLPEDYFEFKNGASKMMVAISPDGSTKIPTGRPELACIRQISHEVIVTLQRQDKLKFLSDYSPKPHWGTSENI